MISVWAFGKTRFPPCGLKQDTPIISRAQAAQTEFGGSEVGDTRRQVAQVAANQIKLHLVERSGAGCRAKVEFMPGIAPLSGNASGEIEQLGHCVKIGSRAS